MSGTNTQPADRVSGGPFLQELDLPAAAAAEASGDPLPGMLTTGERALLSEVVRRTWRGEGAIVDGGSFLGASLVAEARGLEANPVFADLALARFPSGKPIHGYDRGHHPAPANPAAERSRTYGAVEYVLGESFVPQLEETVAPHRDLIELHIGDLTEMSWDGSPVELAFIDVCKTPDLNAHVSRQFYPALIGGSSRLIHQDFFFDRLPWIRVTMGYLADYFRWEGQVASSAVFTTLKAVPREVAAHDPFTEATLEECLAYHDAIEFPGIDRTAQLMLALSRVHLMVHKGSGDRALEQLEDTAVEFADILGAVARAEYAEPTPGGPESMLPGYRMDRAVTEVLKRTGAGAGAGAGAGSGAGAAKGAGRKPPSASEPPSELDRAKAALNRRDWVEARQILEPLREAEPRGPAALMLARTELESGHPEVAGELLDAVLARRSRHERARVLRARVHLVTGDHAAARAEAEEALRTAPGMVAARRVIFDVAVAERTAARTGRPPT